MPLVQPDTRWGGQQVDAGVAWSAALAVGDSVNDIPMFEVADVRVAFGGVHDPAARLHEVADYVVYREEALCRLLHTL